MVAEAGDAVVIEAEAGLVAGLACETGAVEVEAEFGTADAESEVEDADTGASECVAGHEAGLEEAVLGAELEHRAEHSGPPVTSSEHEAVQHEADVVG